MIYYAKEIPVGIRQTTLPVLVVIILLSFYMHVEACTLWASTGNAVAGGGTIVAKNRDNITSLYTRLKAVFPEDGFRFFGILDIEADGYVTAGLNEKGVAVVNAAANSVSRGKRNVATEDVTERILIGYDSVDALFKERDIFKNTHPAIYIVADAAKIMSVEVAPGGRVSVSVTEEGTLALTNHFTDVSLADANEQISRLSLLRLEHIRRLMSEHDHPHCLSDFIAMSRDEDSGSDAAVMRRAREGSRIRTLATWIVRLEPDKAPEVYVGLFNPTEKEETRRIIVDNNFWNLSFAGEDPQGEAKNR